jgi:hypothetical protein
LEAFHDLDVGCGSRARIGYHKSDLCAFDASWFEMALVLFVSVSLAVCAVSNIPFMLGRFKFDSELLETFEKEYVLVVRGRFQLHKNMERGSLV